VDGAVLGHAAEALGQFVFLDADGDEELVGVAPDQPRPFPIGRDPRGQASLRLEARTAGEAQVHDADASSEPGCSRDQKQPCPDDDGSDGSRDSLTGRRETFDGDGCRHNSHRAQVHDPDEGCKIARSIECREKQTIIGS
jgi:hypothetical protein